MFGDFATYYQENAVTAFVEYRDISRDGLGGRSRDLRSALNAASALFHLREHLPLSPPPSRAYVEGLCSDYALLGDIVNAAKHKSLTHQTPHGAALVDSASKLAEQFLVIEYEDDAGIYRYTQKTVVARLADGSERNLLDILTNVLNFWESYLHSVGVLSQKRTFTHDENVRARTRAECESNRLDLEAVQGRRINLAFKLVRFNNATGRADPIDLTGSKLTFNVYRPQYEVEVVLGNRDSGVEFRRAVALSDEEGAVFSKLESDADRRAFVQSLPAAQTALQELANEVRVAAKGSDSSTGGEPS